MYLNNSHDCMGTLNFQCTGPGVICCAAICVATCHLQCLNEKIMATNIKKLFHEMKGVSRDGGTKKSINKSSNRK